MKVRTGFVSNSSSSSFVIAMSKVDSVLHMRKIIEDRIGIQNNSILSPMKKEFVDAFMNNHEPVDIDKEIEEIEEDWDGHEMDSGTLAYIEKLRTFQEKGWAFFKGCFSDNGTEAPECLLCYSTFKINDNYCFIEKETAGY